APLLSGGTASDASSTWDEWGRSPPDPMIVAAHGRRHGTVQAPSRVACCRAAGEPGFRDRPGPDRRLVRLRGVGVRRGLDGERAGPAPEPDSDRRGLDLRHRPRALLAQPRLP